MLGFSMQVDWKGLALTLRAPSKEDLPLIVCGFRSMKVQMNTAGSSARSYEDELEWYEKVRASTTAMHWLIVPNGSDVPVGVTGLDKIDSKGACTSGIIIWDPEWWGRGVASRAHLARTLYAADYLCRTTITSSVRVTNPASFKALERVGYTVWGIEPRSAYRGGRWFDTYHLVWFHPERVGMLYPEGVPDAYTEGIARAELALKLAREVVTFP